jgi:hypothetical protein
VPRGATDVSFANIPPGGAWEKRQRHNLENFSIAVLLAGWFGMRKDFCAFVLGACPLLQEYANIAYHSERRTNGVELQQQSEKSDPSNLKKADLLKPVLPIISIEMPD